MHLLSDFMVSLKTELATLMDDPKYRVLVYSGETHPGVNWNGDRCRSAITGVTVCAFSANAPLWGLHVVLVCRSAGRDHRRGPDGEVFADGASECHASASLSRRGCWGDVWEEAKIGCLEILHTHRILCMTPPPNHFPRTTSPSLSQPHHRLPHTTITSHTTTNHLAHHHHHLPPPHTPTVGRAGRVQRRVEKGLANHRH